MINPYPVHLAVTGRPVPMYVYVQRSTEIQGERRHHSFSHPFPGTHTTHSLALFHPAGAAASQPTDSPTTPFLPSFSSTFTPSNSLSLSLAPSCSRPLSFLSLSRHFFPVHGFAPSPFLSHPFSLFGFFACTNSFPSFLPLRLLPPCPVPLFIIFLPFIFPPATTATISLVSATGPFAHQQNHPLTPIAILDF